jgi:glycerol-3-phosphate O-acyltransferase
VVIGRPLDPFGDDVDDQGVSRDPRGRPIEPTRYLLDGGALTVDPARDAEYTRMLAGRVAESWRKGLVPLPTHVVAYAAFERLHRASRARDLGRFLSDVAPDAPLDPEVMLADVGKLLEELRARAEAGALQAPVERDPAVVIERALRTFATYHERAALTRADGKIWVGDPPLLAYYRNRLDGYGLLGAPARVSNGAQEGSR